MGVTDPSDCCLNRVLQVQILKETLNWGHQQLWQTAVCNSTKLPLFRGAMKFRQHGAAEQQRTPVQRAQTSPRPVSEKYITVQNSFLHMHQLITEKVVQLHLTMQFLHDPTDPKSTQRRERNERMEIRVQQTIIQIQEWLFLKIRFFTTKRPSFILV